MSHVCRLSQANHCSPINWYSLRKWTAWVRRGKGWGNDMVHNTEMTGSFTEPGQSSAPPHHLILPVSRGEGEGEER